MEDAILLIFRVGVKFELLENAQVGRHKNLSLPGPLPD